MNEKKVKAFRRALKSEGVNPRETSYKVKGTNPKTLLLDPDCGRKLYKTVKGLYGK